MERAELGKRTLLTIWMRQRDDLTSALMMVALLAAPTMVSEEQSEPETTKGVLSWLSMGIKRPSFI